MTLIPEVLVWSERVDDDPRGRLHDCTESSALMVLVAGGYTRFPLGIYTPAERNALDASSTRPPNTGDLLPDIDAAVKRRYGVTLRRMAYTSTASLAAELAKPGRAFLITGQPKFFPLGDPLRIHAPLFEGGHAVCVLSLGNGMVLWLDPLAPNKYPGDRVTATKAAQFAWQNWECRYLNFGELAALPDTATASEGDMKTIITISPLPPGSRVGFRPNQTTPLYDANQLGQVDAFVGRTDRNSWAECDATVTIERDPKAAPVGTFRRVATGELAGKLAQKDTVDLSVPAPAEDRTAAVTATALEGLAKAQHAVSMAYAAITSAQADVEDA